MDFGFVPGDSGLCLVEGLGATTALEVTLTGSSKVRGACQSVRLACLLPAFRALHACISQAFCTTLSIQTDQALLQSDFPSYCVLGVLRVT